MNDVEIWNLVRIWLFWLTSVSRNWKICASVRKHLWKLLEAYLPGASAATKSPLVVWHLRFVSESAEMAATAVGVRNRPSSLRMSAASVESVAKASAIKGSVYFMANWKIPCGTTNAISDRI